MNLVSLSNILILWILIIGKFQNVSMCILLFVGGWVIREKLSLSVMTAWSDEGHKWRGQRCDHSSFRHEL